MLAPIRGAFAEPLLWVQPRWLRREFELRAGRDVVATLRGSSLFGAGAVGETAEGRYRIRLANLWRGTVVVHPGDSDTELAVFQPRLLGGGTVRFSGGRTFHIRRPDFWRSRWVLEDETGATLFTLRSRHHLLREQAGVELAPGAERVPELPVLLLLAWHARLRAHRRHAH
ncbi:MAG TPA: hypothetical protein VID50_02380 [Candidatus Eisenbacteria bacterium]|jgi:hypothetical protein